MKQLIKALPWQAVFSHFPYPIFHLPFFFFLLPHHRSLRHFPGLALSFLLLPLSFFLLTACQGEKTANCDPGYHPCENDRTECCLDTTSHFVSWEIDTLGVQGGDNWLMDAAIIDENNIWVVGELHSDSGNFSGAVWDGNEWNLIKLIGRWGAISPRGIFAFDQNQIWIVNGGTIYKWESDSLYIQWDSNWQNGEIDVVRHIWGSSPDDIFFIGNEGTIVHYDGITFKRIDSGTDVDLRSISGTDANNVWVSGYGTSYLRTVLLHYNGVNWRKVIDEDANSDNHPERISGRIKGVFTDDPDNVWVLTQFGLYRCSVNTNGEGIWLGEQSNPTSDMKVIEGFNHNDIYYGGAFTQLWHYNGATFHQYQGLPENGRILGIAANSTVVVIVGYFTNSSYAFVLRGYR